MKENGIELVFILDRSGSMAGLESDTIGGYNRFLEKQDEKEGVRVTTVLFDQEMEILHDGVDPEEAHLTAREYFVRGSTALLDAVGKTILRVSSRQDRLEAPEFPPKTIFVITTDGMENASREFSYPDIHRLISKKRRIDGWEFVFLGANLDVESEAKRLGIDVQKSKRYESTKEGTQAMYDQAFYMCESILKDK